MSKKYWDIIPPEETTGRLIIKGDPASKEYFQRINKLLEEFVKNNKKLNLNPLDQYCLHRNCSWCRAGTCSGVHMISCSCRLCTPYYTGSGATTGTPIGSVIYHIGIDTGGLTS